MLIIIIIAGMSLADDCLFPCDSTYCYTLWIGDLYCDSLCNIKLCDFDSSYYKNNPGLDGFKHSDCLSTGCNASLLGNGNCDD